MQKVQRKEKAKQRRSCWWTGERNGEKQNAGSESKYSGAEGQQVQKDTKENCNETKHRYFCGVLTIYSRLLNMSEMK